MSTLAIELQLSPQTEKRLRSILAQYQDQEAFAQSIIAYQISELKRAILNLRLNLREFEEKYGMTSEEFYREFQSGHLGDAEDFIIWAGLYEMYEENRSKLEELQ